MFGQEEVHTRIIPRNLDFPTKRPNSKCHTLKEASRESLVLSRGAWLFFHSSPWDYSTAITSASKIPECDRNLVYFRLLPYFAA